MYCIKCGKQLQDGTKFCIFCGSKQEEAAPAYTSPAPETPEPSAPVYEPPKAPVFESAPPKFEAAPPVNPEPPQKKKGKGALIASIILGILALALLALNAYQYFVMGADVKDDLKNAEKDLKAAQTELSDLKDDYADLEEDYDELMDSAGNAAETFAKICDYGDGNVIGFGSNEFYAHRSVIVMAEGQKEYFTITCGYSSNVTASLDIDDDDVIDANFSGSWSGDDTDVNVEALEAGVSLITFTNDVNNDTFAVLVIVVG